MLPFRKLIAAAIGLAALLPAATAPAAGKEAAETPEAVQEYLSTLGDIPVGPYLTPTEDLATSVGVAWLTKAAGVGTVEYGVGSPAESSAAEAAPGESHYVMLKGLRPSTRYKYRVKCGQIVSPEYSFLTSPADGKFRLLVGADWHFRPHKDKAAGAQLRTFGYAYPAMKAFAPNVVLVSGDNNEYQRTSFYRLLNTCRDLLAGAVFMPTIGNHEWHSGGTEIFKELFRLPPNGPANDLGQTFAAVYGKVQFIVGHKMTPAWMETHLAKSAGKTNFTVFSVHYPIHYSNTLQSAPGKVPADWLAMTKKYPIDFVFYGHRHQFERTYPVLPNPYDAGCWGVIASLDRHSYGNLRGATIYQQTGSMWYGFTTPILDLYHVPRMHEKANGTFTMMSFDGPKVSVETRGFAYDGSVKDALVDRYEIDKTREDKAKPKITEGPSVETTGFQAVVRWKTDVPAMSWVMFGMEAGKPRFGVPYEDTDQRPVTDHAVTINCLTPETKYYYFVASSAGAVTSVQGEQTFTTGPGKPGMVVGVFDFGPVEHLSAAGAVKAPPFKKRENSWFGWDPAAAVEGGLTNANDFTRKGLSDEKRSRQTFCWTTDGKWSAAVPNGKYDLAIVAGGKAWRPQPFEIILEDGQVAVKHTKTATLGGSLHGAIDDHTARVTVADGRLDVHIRGLEKHTRIPTQLCEAEINLLTITVAKE